MEHDDQHLIAYLRNTIPAAGSSDWHHIALEFGYLSDDCRSFDRPYGTDPLDELRVEMLVGDDGTQYPWELRYNSLHHARLSDLEPRVVLLKAINRKLARWDKEWAEPSTFGQYAFRIAKAIGAAAYLRSDCYPSSRGDAWETFQMDSLAMVADRFIRQAVEKIQKASAHVQPA